MSDEPTLLELVTYYVWETKQGHKPFEVSEIDLFEGTSPQEAVEFIAELDIADLDPLLMAWPLTYYVQIGSTTAPILEIAVNMVPSFSLETNILGFFLAPESGPSRLHALGKDLKCLESCIACGAERLSTRKRLAELSG